MLRQRILTASILLVVLIGALLASSLWPLVALLGVAATCALWEWLRMTWPGRADVVPSVTSLLFVVLMAASAFEWLAGGSAGWAQWLQASTGGWLTWIVAGLWVFGATATVVQGHVHKKQWGVVLSVFAVIAVWVAWAALVQMYVVFGAWFLVSLMAFIWVADIAAYFVGKKLGKHKLAPRVSPGKTWEGAVGGVCAAVVWVVVSSAIPDSFGAVLVQRWSWLGAIVLAIGLAGLSIVGDLFESVLKRRANVKDSSQLLPGHGGVYDRIDALLPVAPVAFLLAGAGAP